MGTADIVGNHFKFVGLSDVMLCKGLNFIAARVFGIMQCCARVEFELYRPVFFFVHGLQDFFERGPRGERG